jgi:AAA15 family ATPase/GTPase
MITKLSIKNFKSIKEMDIDCTRVNLFIGEPNTGKSNILESLGLLSWSSSDKDEQLSDFVRFEYMQNLFYDNIYDNLFEIVITNEQKAEISVGAKFYRENDSFRIYYQVKPDSNLNTNLRGNDIQELNTNGQRIISITGCVNNLSFIKFYRFKEQTKFPSKFPAWLLPPNGSNLVSLLIGNKKARETASNLFKSFGFKVMFREHVDTLEQAKLIDDDIYSYPYIAVSDTLKRMLFYNAAIDSNENSTLVFEEPETHAFPLYIKELGEKIAFDESNQYFIVTHNPYLFLSIVEKTPKVDVNVFATYMKDYQTKVKQASHEQISMLMDYDPFANLGQIIEENDNDSD